MSLSKALLASFPYNCYEIGHTWTPHCSQAWLDLWFSTFVRSLKLYGVLYLVSQIVSRRYGMRAFVQTFKSAINSSMFISQNFFLYLALACTSRQLLGRLHMFPATFLAGFLSAGCAILIERPGRRAVLAVYMLNLASDIIYRMLRSRGLVKDVPYGEVAIFALSLGSYIYYARKHGYVDDAVTFAIRHVIGEGELEGTDAATRTSNGKGSCQGDGVPPNGHIPQLASDSCYANGSQRATSPMNGTCKDNSNGGVKRSGPVNGTYAPTSQLGWASRFLKSRHASCRHTQGCLLKLCQTLVKYGSLGCAAGFGLSLFGDLRRGRRKRLLEHILGSTSVRGTCFLAGLSGAYSMVSCSLRWMSDGQRDWHGMVAGCVAGLASMAAPSSNASLYILWKLVELVYLKSAEENLVPSFRNAPVLLYAFCTGLMLYVAVIEPHNLRPQYLKFLDDICGNLMSKINRAPLDILGHHSSAAFPGYFPVDLDPKYVSKEFLQTVLIWA